MLSIQHRGPDKKIILRTGAHAIIFYREAVPCPRFSTAVSAEGRMNLFCHLLTVGQWHRLRQHGSFANLLFFENRNRIKMQSQRYCGMPRTTCAAKLCGEAAKRLRNKNTALAHKGHHFYSVSFWPIAHAANG